MACKLIQVNPGKFHLIFSSSDTCIEAMVDNNLIYNELHKIYLHVVYEDNVSSFEELLQRDKSFTIYERNI